MPAPEAVAPPAALVTGAAGGIGSRVTHRLAARGVPVIAVDRDADGSKALRAVPGRISIVRADVTRPEEVARVVAEGERDMGPIGYLVNAAGVLRPGETTDLTESDWAETFAVNTTGVFLVTRAVLGGMIARRRGSIVTVSSNAARTPRSGMTAYAASKAAATQFTKCVALETARYGIRCNIVAPGSTDTDMLRTSWRGEDRASQTVTGAPESFRLGIPLGRIADPDDVVDAIEFLLYDSAGHITMQELTVDGGATLGV
ncbi:2,3-dihydro-2,3-dihydroxybenzoate dehydrogenase [Nocardia takedensis]